MKKEVPANIGDGKSALCSAIANTLTPSVENKEERVEDSYQSIIYTIADRIVTGRLSPIETARRIYADVTLAKQQSQSIEGIVGFVLEWLNTHAQPMDIVVGGFQNHKSDIIKELNNGK